MIDRLINTAGRIVDRAERGAGEVVIVLLALVSGLAPFAAWLAVALLLDWLQYGWTL